MSSEITFKTEQKLPEKHYPEINNWIGSVLLVLLVLIWLDARKTKK